MSVLYLDHFQLTTDPFRITPDTEFFFTGGQRGDILEGLVVAAMHDEGIVCVVGEVGMGKTMLSRMLLERLQVHPADTVYLANPVFDRDEILDAIARDLMPEPPQGSRARVIAGMERVLIDRFAAGRRVVVVIDEAHTMPAATLEEIRLLSNLETAHNKLLKIILFGQPELDELLAAPQLRQVKDRISHRFVLQPLDAQEARTYLGFRLRKAGLNGADIMEPEASSLLWQASQGRTRRLNMLGEKSLLAAYADASAVVTADHARRACQDETEELRQLRVDLPGGIAQNPVNRLVAAPWNKRWFSRVLMAGALMATALGGYGVSRWTAPHHESAMALAPTASTAPGTAAVAAAPAPVAEAVVVKPADLRPRPSVKPVAPTPVAAADWSAAGGIAERIKASEKFIAQTGGAGFTVQLLAMRGPRHEQLGARLAEYQELLGTAQPILANDPAYQGVPHHAVYVGQFASREAAAQYIATLPESLRRQRPLVRSFARILKEPQS